MCANLCFVILPLRTDSCFVGYITRCIHTTRKKCEEAASPRRDVPVSE